MRNIALSARMLAGLLLTLFLPLPVPPNSPLCVKSL